MMKKKHRTNFLLGAAFGALICAIVWYWQKSTADEGALDLLDRLAETQAKMRRYAETAEFIPPQVQQVLQTQPPPATPAPFDWKQINGIGPTFARRLHEAGIVALPDLAHADPDKIREITKLQSWHVHDPQDWIDEAQRLLNQ
jgi:predicted flap endonuclease-1-like 5' DNA nuclease